MFWLSFGRSGRAALMNCCRLPLFVQSRKISVCVFFGPSLCRHTSCLFHALKKWHFTFRREKVDVLVFFSRSRRTALPDGLLPVDVVCLEQEDSLCILVSFAGSGK